MWKNMHIMSINVAKTLVWRHDCDVNCDITNSTHQVPMTTICHWMKPLHENFQRTPLIGHNQRLSRRVRRWARRRSQSSKNDFFDVCFPVSTADFHSLLLQASFSHEVLVMLNAFRSRFSTSRKHSFGRPIGRGALGSSLYRTCFGRRLSSIRHTWPAHRRRRCLMMTMMS